MIDGRAKIVVLVIREMGVFVEVFVRVEIFALGRMVFAVTLLRSVVIHVGAPGFVGIAASAVAGGLVPVALVPTVRARRLGKSGDFVRAECEAGGGKDEGAAGGGLDELGAGVLGARARQDAEA